MMSKRFLIGIVSAIIIFALLISSTILIFINNAYNYNAYQDDETGTTVYIGNLLMEIIWGTLCAGCVRAIQTVAMEKCV